MIISAVDSMSNGHSPGEETGNTFSNLKQSRGIFKDKQRSTGHCSRIWPDVSQRHLQPSLLQSSVPTNLGLPPHQFSSLPSKARFSGFSARNSNTGNRSATIAVGYWAGARGEWRSVLVGVRDEDWGRICRTRDEVS